MNAAAKQLIAALQLAPLPQEGGYFRQTWLSPASSAILFLLTPVDFSAIHRIAQDELWHFYAGDPVDHLQFDLTNRTLELTRLGSAILGGERPQVPVRAGTWQGARICENGSAYGWALLGCTVSPPWDPQRFELAQRAELVRTFPAQTELIHQLTR